LIILYLIIVAIAAIHSPIQQQSKASVMEVDYSTEISNNHSLDFPESNSFNEDHRSYLISSIDNTHIWPTE